MTRMGGEPSSGLDDAPPQTMPEPAPLPPPIDDLVFELLDRGEREPESRESLLDELCRRWPSRAAELRAAVGQLEHIGLLGEGELPASIGEFRPIRRLGRGGMGVVLLAEQPSLERRVALKLVRSDELMRPTARVRFRREVEAVARLAHPNVVGIHAVGEEDGTPFLVMDYVPGVSLERLVRAYDGAAPEALGAREFRAAINAVLVADEEDEGRTWDEGFFGGSWTEICLRIAREVARALAHAHSRGVLHRDVKPSNVIVTPEGRVQLVDFGLASLTDTERLTRTGTQLGSLPYMAPELLERGEQADQRADVYSLGVTLYELLTLALPFREGGPESLTAQIIDGRLVAASKRNPSLSRDVETVLRCAVERDAAHRYASAEAMAADLSNLIDGRPIAARPAGLMRRATDWVRRHPGAASAAGLAVVIAIGGPLAFGVVQRSHASELGEINAELETLNLDLERSLADERAASTRADGHFWRVSEAVSVVLRRLALLGLEHEPRMQGVRLEVADTALRIFDALRTERPDDARVLESWGRLLRTRADILSDLGRHAEAVGDYAGHLEVFEQLLAKSPDDPVFPYEVASGFVQYAAALESVEGRGEDAMASGQRACDAFRRLAAEAPDLPSRRSGLVLALQSQAQRYLETGSTEGLDEMLSEALEEAELVRSRWPETRKVHERHGYVLTTMARLAARDTDAERAAHLAAEALESFSEELERSPGNRRVQACLAEVGQLHATQLVRLRRFGEARDEIDRCERLLEELRGRYPSIVLYQRMMLETLGLRSFLEVELGNQREAVEYGERAVALGNAFLAGNPSDIAVERKLIGDLGNLANRIVMADVLGPDRYSRAEQCAREALERTATGRLDEERLAGLRPYARYNLILALVRQDRTDETWRELGHLTAETPPVPMLLRYLADGWSELADLVLRTDGDDALRRTALDSTLDALEHAVDAGYRDRRELLECELLAPLRGDERFQAVLERAGSER